MSTLKKYKYLLFILITGALIGGIVLLRQKHIGSKPFSAVFLTNDQVYFGHTIKNTKEIILLEDVYYLKANAQITGQDEKNKEGSVSAQLSLVKLGEELHSPQDHMTISKNQVLFWEDMKDKGVIMDAITEHERQNKNK